MRATAIGQLVAIATQLLSVVVLARLLSPEDYGLLAMVMAIVVIGEVIREFGLASAAIQAPDLPRQHRTNLFWWNTGLGGMCALALFLCAPLIADFYHEPRITEIAQALSLTFLLGGVTTQPKAHLARDLRFGALALTDVLPGALGLAGAIVAALLGWGVWALVAQRLIIAISMLVLAVSFDRWLPGLPRRSEGMRPLLRYGLNLVGTQLVSGTSRNVDYIVMGHRFGAEATGLYSRAFELVINTLNQINAPSTKVAVPILSRLQHDEARFTSFLLRGQRTLLFVIIPILGVGATLAEPLVQLALGPQWSAVVPFVQALAVVAATDKILGYATWWYALSRAKTDVTFKVTVVKSVLLITGIIVGSASGPLGVAWGYAAATTLGWLADLAMYRWLADAPSGKLFTNALVALFMNAIPVAGTLAAAHWLSDLHALAYLLAGLGTYFALWLSVCLSVPAFRTEMSDAIRLIRRLKR
ncbi:lipopolysaccharide biosynthesis protein [Microbacterium sp. zg.Y625]|nr:lipopolysaccharide biosynthesis protein [Microbacterium sp. zg-Y625]MCR2793524.1 lipopolysaccharide biosynthesis protein [Microbacterium sp. zg.Y625]WIM25878.1 lipopolysaccharide biosynthesis protein [Microbacterium sp. zg-Y625]